MTTKLDSPIGLGLANTPPLLNSKIITISLIIKAHKVFDPVIGIEKHSMILIIYSYLCREQIFEVASNFMKIFLEIHIQ